MRKRRMDNNVSGYLSLVERAGSAIPKYSDISNNKLAERCAAKSPSESSFRRTWDLHPSGSQASPAKDNLERRGGSYFISNYWKYEELCVIINMHQISNSKAPKCERETKGVRRTKWKHENGPTCHQRTQRLDLEVYSESIACISSWRLPFLHRICLEDARFCSCACSKA